MIKALFVDFYGTVVHEDGAVIKVITQMIKDTGDGSDTSEIGSFWWNDFQTRHIIFWIDGVVSGKYLSA